MIHLNPYTKRVAARVLNSVQEFTKRYSPQDIIGIRLINGVVQVRVKDGDRLYAVPFDPRQFKAAVEACRLEVIAALSTEAAWERRHKAIAMPRIITRIVNLVRFMMPRLFTYSIEAI